MQAITSSLDVQGVCAAACAQSSEDVSDTTASDTTAVPGLHVLELPEPSSAANSQQGEGSCRSSAQCSSRAASVQSANTSDLAVAGLPGLQQQTVLHAPRAGMPTHETQAGGHAPVRQQEQQDSDDPQQSTDQPCQLQQLLARYSLLRHTVSRLEPSIRCERQRVVPPHDPAAALVHRAHQHSPQLPPLPAPQHQQRQQPQALQPGHQQAPVAQSGCQPAQLRCSGTSSHTGRQPRSPSTQLQQQQKHPWLQDPPHGQQQSGRDQQQQQPAEPDPRQTPQGQQLQQQQQELQRMPADPPDPGRPAAQEQGKQQQVPVQQQQLYSVPLSSRPWGWWRPVGGCVLPGLDGVRLPLLQLHGALGSTHSSAALLQAMGRPGPQQHPPATCVGPALLECWQHLLAVEQVRQQVASTSLQQQQHEQQQQRCWSPPPPPQQQQQHQQKHRPEVSSTSSGQGTSPPACHLASEASAGAAAAAEASSVPAVSSKAAAAKPPKRPWQPRMQPDEPNWDKVRDCKGNPVCATFLAPQVRHSHSSTYRG